MDEWIRQYDSHLWPEAVHFGDVIYPPGGGLGPRIQQTHELVLIHTGEMTVWVDHTACYAPAGSITLLFPGHEERFAFARDRETYHSFVHLTLTGLPQVIDEHLRVLPRSLALSPSMHDLITRGLALRSSGLSTALPMAKAVAVQMLWRYIGEGSQTGADIPTPHPAVERVRHYIQHHLGDPLTLDMLAAAGAVSPSHLIRLFQHELHTTPMAYLWDRRVAHGIELLENTGLPVGVIAERCGFQTSYHFSRRVREATGQPPLHVRRRAWQRGSIP